MSRWIFLGAGLVALPMVVAGQSLGDAARKENDRRERLHKAGVTSRTFTEGDLATTKGRLANDPREQTAAPANDAVSDDSGRREKQERYWRARAAEARARVEAARQRNDALQSMIRLGQPGRYDANGRRVIYSLHRMKSMADAAAAELAAAEAAFENLLEEGRRAGALPGWLR
jgi:hypothetical protein